MVTQKKLTPRTATSNNKICKLKSEGVDFKDSWIVVDEDTVYIYNQKSGEEPTGRVEISRRDFNCFVDWYNGVKP